MHGRDEPRQPLVDAGADVGEAGGLPAHVGARRAVGQRRRDDLGAQPLGGLVGRLVLRTGGRVGDHRHQPAGPGRGRRADRRDARVGGEGAAQRRDHGGVAGRVDDHQQRTVDPGAEAVGEQVVGLPLGSGLGQGAVVGDAGPQRERRCGEREQQADHDDDVHAADAETTCSTRRCQRASERVRRERPRPPLTRCPAMDSSAGSRVIEASTITSTITETATAAGRHERHPGDGEAEDRDHDDAAGEHDRRPAVGTARRDRLGDRHARGEVLAVPGEDEQRVVDPDAEADHRAEHRRPGGYVDQVRHQRQRADRGGRARSRRRRSGCRPRRRSRTRPAGSPARRRCRRPRRRSRARRTRRPGRRAARPAAGCPRRPRSRSSCSAVRSSTDSSSSVGYWIESSATRPSARSPARRRSSTCGSARPRRGAAPRRARAAASGRRRTSCAVSPAWPELAASSESRSPAGSPGRAPP